LIVVIGIICVLLGILLPILRGMWSTSVQARTNAQIAKLATVIQFYYTANSAYPGPIPESMIWGCNTRGTQGQQQNLPFQSPTPFCVAGQTDLTSSENFVLGLLGGLTRDGTGGSPTFGQVIYDKNLLVNQSGPRGLGNTPQQFPAYTPIVPTELASDSSGQPASWTTANGP